MSAITADTVGALSPRTRVIVAAERTRLPRRVWVGISIVAVYVLAAVFAPSSRHTIRSPRMS